VEVREVVVGAGGGSLPDPDDARPAAAAGPGVAHDDRGPEITHDDPFLVWGRTFFAGKHSHDHP